MIWGYPPFWETSIFGLGDLPTIWWFCHPFGRWFGEFGGPVVHNMKCGKFQRATWMFVPVSAFEHGGYYISPMLNTTWNWWWNSDMVNKPHKDQTDPNRLCWQEPPEKLVDIHGVTTLIAGIAGIADSISWGTSFPRSIAAHAPIPDDFRTVPTLVPSWEILCKMALAMEIPKVNEAF